MFCHSCGTQVREGSPFCTNCGARQLDAPQPGATMMYQPEQPAPAQPVYPPPAPQGWQNPAQAGYGQQPPPQSAYGGQQQYYQQPQAYPQAQPPSSQQGYPQAQPYYPQSQPYYPQPAAAARPSQTTMIASLLMVAAGALVAISPLLAWAKASAPGQSDTESFADYIDDFDKNIGLLIIIFVIAGVAVIGGILRYLGKLDTAMFTAWAAITGIAAVAEAIYQFVQFKDLKDDFGDRVDLSLSFGYYILMAGCVLCVAAIVVNRTRSRRV